MSYYFHVSTEQSNERKLTGKRNVGPLKRYLFLDHYDAFYLTIVFD